MKRAIVLSGGGSKGAYQIGFWKAIRKLDINYDIVTGTSIGALNGAFMVQGDYSNAFKLWYFMDYDKVLEDNVNFSYDTFKGKKEIIMKYAKGAIKGGLNVPNLEKTIIDNFKPDLFFNSPVDYGLVTVKFPSLKPVMVTKDKLTKENLPDYLLASSACFPAFKMKNIDNENYIDGGYYDNLPIDLAIKLGADEVIAVNLKSIDELKKKFDPNIKIKLIAPKEDIGNFLVLEKKQVRKLMKLGYNDTMKAFDALEGDFYTFNKGSLERNLKRNKDKFYENFNTYLGELKNKTRYKGLLGKDKVNEFNKVFEQTAKAFNIDNLPIYRASVMNVLIKKAYKKSGINSFKNIKGDIKNKKLKRFSVSMELICYFYDEMRKDSNPGKLLNNLAILFPSSYLCALYLKTIME